MKLGMLQLEFANENGLDASGELKRVFGVAYKGDNVIRQPWEELPVVIDLAGVEFAPQIPLLFNHENNPDMRLGKIDAAIIDGAIVVEGVIDGATEKGRRCIELGQRIPWQLSIGAYVEEAVPSEGPVEVNGSQFENVLVVRRCVLREVSIVAVGAALATYCEIAAALKLKDSSLEKEKKKMDEMKEKEAKRVEAVAAILADHGEICAKAIREGWSESQAQSFADSLKAVEAKLPESAPNIISKGENDNAFGVLKAAFEMRAGLEPKADEKTLEAAYKMRNISLKEMMGEAMRLEGKPVPAHFDNDAIRAAFSTISVPTLLSDVANKRVKKAFESASPIAPRICAAGDLNDYKVATRVNINAIGDLGEIEDGEEIPNGSIGESTATNQAKSYAKLITLGHKSIVNDDLGEFLRLPEILGKKAAHQIDKVFFKRLLANPTQGDGVALFNAGHGNYLAGSTYALSKDALQAAKALFMKQTDISGDPIAVAPRYLLVPPELEPLAQELAQSPMVNGATTANKFLPTMNVIQTWGLEVIASPYLSNANYTGNSATGWYLLADPEQAPTFEIGYLRGQREPIVEQAEAPFNFIGMQFRVRFDFGVREQDFRGMVFANGNG